MTVEERAERYMNDYPHMDDSHYGYYVKDGYIQGATDQHKIDIEKAWSWFVEKIKIFQPTYVRVNESFKDKLLRERLKEDFIKAMEE